MKSPGDTDGFSLFEMLVVLVLVSTVSGILFSGTARQNQTLDSVIQKIGEAVQVSSMRAISKGEKTEITVDVRNLTIAVAPGEQKVSIPSGFGVSLLTGAELIESPNIGSIEFYEDGTSSGGEIKITDGAGNFGAVRVHWLTGAMTVTKDMQR